MVIDKFAWCHKNRIHHMRGRYVAAPFRFNTLTQKRWHNEHSKQCTYDFTYNTQSMQSCNHWIWDINTGAYISRNGIS